MRIAVCSGSGLGGTEKAAAAFALGLKQRGHVVDWLGTSGPRTEELEKQGIPALGVSHEASRLAAYLNSAHPEVVHQHVSGTPLKDHPLYQVWPKLGMPSPLLIETNIFGRLDDIDSAGLASFRMFVSLTSGTQAFLRAGKALSSAALEHHTVLYNPVEAHERITAAKRQALRHELGVGEDEILALRIGRPSSKWRPWECEAFALAKRRHPKLRLLLIEPPDALTTAVHCGHYGQGISVLPATSDFRWLRELYCAAELMVHAADFGESFGYTIAEAMAAGLPLIVRTTPWGDNAQTELVQNGLTGFVCASVPEMARRWANLAADPTLRTRMGDAGRKRMDLIGQLDRELDVLEDVLRKLKGGTVGPNLLQRNEQWLAFARTIREREWQISERSCSHPLDYLHARLHSGYRSLRSTVRMWRERRQR
jgi:hypothetical protein